MHNFITKWLRRRKLVKSWKRLDKHGDNLYTLYDELSRNLKMFKSLCDDNRSHMMSELYQLANFEVDSPFDNCFDQLDDLVKSIELFDTAHHVALDAQYLNRTTPANLYYSYNKKFAFYYLTDSLIKIIDHHNRRIWEEMEKDDQFFTKNKIHLIMIRRRIVAIYMWCEMLMGIYLGMNGFEIGGRYVRGK